jgi:hypothetical protein
MGMVRFHAFAAILCRAERASARVSAFGVPSIRFDKVFATFGYTVFS